MQKNITLSQELAAGTLKNNLDKLASPAMPRELPSASSSDAGFNANNYNGMVGGYGYGTLVIDPTSTGMLPSPGTERSSAQASEQIQLGSPELNEIPELSPPRVELPDLREVYNQQQHERAKHEELMRATARGFRKAQDLP